MREMTPRKARMAADLTQAEMGTLLGISRGAYIEKEQDPGRFTVREAWQFCKATETKFDEVFGKGGQE